MTIGEEVRVRRVNNTPSPETQYEKNFDAVGAVLVCCVENKIRLAYFLRHLQGVESIYAPDLRGDGGKLTGLQSDAISGYVL
jgi:hypothetical protein